MAVEVLCLVVLWLLGCPLLGLLWLLQCPLLAPNLGGEWHLTDDQFDNVIAIDIAPRRADCPQLDLTKWVS